MQTEEVMSAARPIRTETLMPNLIVASCPSRLALVMVNFRSVLEMLVPGSAVVFTDWYVRTIMSHAQFHDTRSQ